MNENELDLIKLNIFESYDNGEITYGEKEYLLEQVDYMYEKHVPPKRRKENLRRREEVNRKLATEMLKKEYDYDDETKTINIGNRRIPIDLGSSDSTSYAYDVRRDDPNCIKNERICINSKEMRDPISYVNWSINHEIGHAIHHSPKSDPKITNDSNRQKYRQDIKKHENHNINHANSDEFEADLYAASKSTKGTGINALKHSYRNGEKEAKKDKYRYRHQRDVYDKQRRNKNMEFRHKHVSKHDYRRKVRAKIKERDKYFRNGFKREDNKSLANYHNNDVKIDMYARTQAANDPASTEYLNKKRNTEFNNSKTVKESTFDLLLESINDLYNED